MKEERIFWAQPQFTRPRDDCTHFHAHAPQTFYLFRNDPESTLQSTLRHKLAKSGKKSDLRLKFFYRQEFQQISRKVLKVMQKTFILNYFTLLLNSTNQIEAFPAVALLSPNTENLEKVPLFINLPVNNQRSGSFD